jgi:hypothetical protein
MDQGYYHLSKDYEALYYLALNGHKIFCLSDYRGMSWKEGQEIRRDPCLCQINGIRKGISFTARGISYGDCDAETAKYFKQTEKEYFISLCKSQNIEWVVKC